MYLKYIFWVYTITSQRVPIRQSLIVAGRYARSTARFQRCLRQSHGPYTQTSQGRLIRRWFINDAGCQMKLQIKHARRYVLTNEHGNGVDPLTMASQRR